MQKKFLSALSGQSFTTPPFWFMRQAGRYLPEYRATREKAGSFLKLCFNPELAAEVTIQPIDRYGMDAAILFADILVIPQALGVEVRFEHGEGPKLGKFRAENLEFKNETLQPIYETLKLLSKQYKNSETAIIGFAGSPWTVATYMVEGGSSKDFHKTKALAFSNPTEFQRIIDKVVDATAKYLIEQVNAGAEALQVFDSWAGELTPDEFRKWVIAPTIQIVKQVKAAQPHIKIIGFPRKAGLMYKEYAEQTGVDAIGLDQTVSLDWAFANIKLPLQGNLDPAILLASPDAIRAEAKKILEAAQGKPFIFNLGHGISQFTPPENVADLCDFIKSYK